jgi:hypothetical protein
MAEILKDLAERGFIRVNKPRLRSEAAPAATPVKENGKSAETGKVEAYTPRIRAIGLD